jgi:transcriptional regulator with XRE-family HTH domain
VEELKDRVVQRVREAAAARGIPLTHLPDRAGVSRSHFWDVLAGRASPTLKWLARVASALDVPPAQLLEEPNGGELTRPLPRIPFYPLRVAAGALRPGDVSEPSRWIEPKTRRRLHPGHFASLVEGRSMEPLIPDGGLCLFELYRGGDPEGRILLVEYRGLDDVETGGSYTVKRFRRGRARRAGIRLEPINPSFEPILLDGASAPNIRLIADFVEVLPR